MTISTLLMILALTVGAGTNQSSGSDSSTTTDVRTGKIAGNCWINGVWYNPCPAEDGPSRDPDKGPIILLPT